jgi:hypothetical protein
MTNVTNLAIGGTVNTSFGQKTPQVVSHEIDIATAIANGLNTTEFVVVLNIPAHTHVQLYNATVVNALSLGSGARIDIGDSGSATRFVNNATTLTAGTNLTLAASERYYATADTLRLTVTGATLASGLLRFTIGLVDCTRNAAAVAPTL